MHAGNLDNKDLIAGTTLYLPVYAAGALFSVGDAHAAQGHGEVDVSAIETGNRVDRAEGHEADLAKSGERYPLDRHGAQPEP
jgi:hypothetical protein